MKVFVLNSAVDYEGELTQGVYSTREKAIDAARLYGEQLSWDPIQEFVKPNDRFWAQSEFSSSQLYIHEFELDGEQ